MVHAFKNKRFAGTKLLLNFINIEYQVIQIAFLTFRKLFFLPAIDKLVHDMQVFIFKPSIMLFRYSFKHQLQNSFMSCNGIMRVLMFT